MHMKTPFVHLHTHSHYSLLDGLSKVDEMVTLAKKYDMPAIGLTDHGNMYGAIEFYKTCKDANIKPIIGVEAYIANRTRFDKEPTLDNKRYHLTLLAKNKTGYENLIKLVTASHLEGYYYKPRMDIDLLRTHAEGLICLSGCFGSELSHALRNKNEKEAERIALLYQNLFGKENYFFEIMHHPGVPGLMDVRTQIIELGKKLDIPLVATADSHYLHEDDGRAHETLLAIQTNSDMNDENRFSMASDHFSFINTETAYEYFKDTPEAVENTFKIGEMCDIILDLGTWVFPDVRIEESKTYDDELRRLAFEGIQRRGLATTPELTARMEHELDVIKSKGYAPYFLVVADLLKFAKENTIYTTIRGSVAGSLVTYLLDITKVNPLEYKLPFERFLNPERPSPPDIDMDYADNRRDEMIQYAKDKYGADKVAQIGTFGTMLARGVVRDVARALGHPYNVGDRISKLIPLGSQGFPMTLDRALEMDPELATMYKTEATVKEIIDLGKKLEGCVRHVSVHAAGVVIAPTSLTAFTPTQFDPKGGKIITQYDMHAVEDAGLLKFDFLGIRNLSILADAVAIVKREHNIDLNIEQIPLDDANTFTMLAKGETMGLFQLNGTGMTRYLMELKPSSIHDINAMVALYRPGPMECIPQYIERKHDPSRITYLDPRMKGILSQSYGVITYQDDVLLIAIELAGYSWLEADKLRKAMGKKIPAVMEAEKEKLKKGLIKNGMTPEKAAQLWLLIEPFAAYGFNKAHAASYGRVAYQTAYMKANYAVEYMSAVLTAESGDVEKVAEIVAECKRMGIPVLPPDVNESFGQFTIVRGNSGSKIRFGLFTIKNFGEGIGTAIIEERERKGKFTSLTNFLERIKNRNLNKKSLEALIQCGAFDAFEERGIMLGNMDMLLAYNKEAVNNDGTQVSLFGALPASMVSTLRLLPTEPMPAHEKLRFEKELLGLYISGHPLEAHRAKLEERKTNLKMLREQSHEGMLAIACGLVGSTKQTFTKRGDKMLFLTVEDMTDNLEIVVFPKVLLEFGELLQAESCVSIKGKMSKRNGTLSMIAEAVKAL